MNVKTTVGVNLLLRKDETLFESKSLIKWKIPGFSTVFSYFGLKYSLDGITFLIGMKIGGVKLLFPIVILNKITQKTLD